jgi:hypothetical protein
LILDVDVWKKNVEIPHFSVAKSARYYVEQLENTVKKIVNQFAEEIR